MGKLFTTNNESKIKEILNENKDGNTKKWIIILYNTYWVLLLNFILKYHSEIILFFKFYYFFNIISFFLTKI